MRLHDRGITGDNMKDENDVLSLFVCNITSLKLKF